MERTYVTLCIIHLRVKHFIMEENVPEKISIYKNHWYGFYVIFIDAMQFNSWKEQNLILI